MKRKKLKEIAISLFLLSSLVFAFILVSCSEEDNLLFNSNNINNGNPNFGTEGPISSAISSTFAAIGEGAGEEIGEMGMGWVLGAMGLTSQSTDWAEQLAKIDQDLDSIITLLGDADNELESIDSTLNIINCAEQQSSLQTEIGTLKNLYDQYNAILTTSSNGDTVATTVLQDWTDQVLAQGNYSGNTSVGDIIGTIQANLGITTGAIIACIQNIPQPGAGTFGQDTNYYNQAGQFTNYYYYYQTIGLGMLSEAYHYNAWVNAGSPGGTFASADSIQLVCSDNGTSKDDCNNVITQMNTQYNALIGQFTGVGAPYTGEHLLYQVNSSNEPVVWIKSMEDFTKESGSSCTYPLGNYNLCGPCAGEPGATLSFTTYRYTSQFEFASPVELSGLVSSSDVSNYSNIAEYLDSAGFIGMDTGMIFIADTVISVDVHYTSGIYAVPFIDCSVKNNGYFTSDNFNDIMAYTYDEIGTCVSYDALYKTEFKNDSDSANAWYFHSGYSEFCRSVYGGSAQISQNLTWNSNSDAPGWSYTASGSSGSPYNSAPAKRLLLPMRKNFTGNIGCTLGRSYLNKGNMITKCGSDLTIFLTSNIPKPPTCSLQNINPPCTSL